MTYLKHAIQQLTDLVQQNMSKQQNKDGDEFQWDVNVEILFLHSLFGLKPVGVNRFFTMREIHSRFSNFMQRELSSKILWDHLDSMYDMAALHESEVLPFPNEETPFELSQEFDDLVKEKFGVSLTHSINENDTPKSGSSLKEAKKNTPKLKQMLPPASNAKNTFLTPGAVKTTKSTDSRPPSAETTPKARPESQPLLKSGKVKRASSPKNAKPEAPTAVKEEPSEVATAKKKVESSSAKKASKSESNVVTGSSKKSLKQDPNTSLGKGKSETPEGAGKKVKPEKEVAGKKGKVSIDNSSAKKSVKVEGKKTETDNHKRVVDTPNQKTKSERNSTASNKSSKHDGLDSPVPSGSKKQSTGKAVVDYNDKKRRRSKVDDSAKKTPVAAKRRRI